MIDPRKAPVKTKKVELAGDYAGWWFEIKTTIKWGDIRKAARSENDIETQTELLSKLIVSWNFVDEDGNPLPQPYGNPEAFDEVSLELLQIISQHVLDVLQAVRDAAAGGDLKNFVGGFSRPLGSEEPSPSSTSS